ncbi:hypothetical protein [Streptomyces sp. NPDC050982]|uniref:hypothetical protein n=1 Tax=Streptomyces sp. NPDC050982 TaxID=3154746 RepID=UPI0033C90224
MEYPTRSDAGHRKLVGTHRCSVRLRDTTLYASFARYDGTLLVNPHAWGQPASANPLIPLRRLDGTGWFDHYTDGFQVVWKTAKPRSPETM